MQSASDLINVNNKRDNERFEALFQYASMGILVANNKGEIVMVNDFLLKIFRYDSTSELIGNKIELLIPYRYHPGHIHHRDDYINKPQRRPMGLGMDLFALRKDSTEFPVEISLSNYDTDEGVFAIAFITDITKRKEIEQAVLSQKEQLAAINIKIEELNNELEQKVELRTKQLKDTMEQLEASKDEITKALSKEKELSELKSRFVSMASHEFRSPLTTLRTITELLAHDRISDEPRRRQSYVFLERETIRLQRLVEDLLDFGRLESGRRQYRLVPQDVFALVREAVADFREDAIASGFQIATCC